MSSSSPESIYLLKKYYYEGLSSTGIIKRYGPYNYNEFLDLYIKNIIKYNNIIYIADNLNKENNMDIHKYILNNVSLLNLQLHKSILLINCNEYVISDELINNCLYLNIGNEYKKLLNNFKEAFTVYLEDTKSDYLVEDEKIIFCKAGITNAKSFSSVTSKFYTTYPDFVVQYLHENTLIWQPWNKYWVSVGNSNFKFNLDYHSTYTSLALCDLTNFSPTSTLSFLPPAKNIVSFHKVSDAKNLVKIISDPNETPIDNPELNAIQSLLIMHSDALEFSNEIAMSRNLPLIQDKKTNIEKITISKEISIPNKNDIIDELKRFKIDASILVPPNATVWVPFRIYIKYSPNSCSAVNRPPDNRPPIPSLGPQEVRELEEIYKKASNTRKDITAINQSMPVEQVEASMSAILSQREKLLTDKTELLDYYSSLSKKNGLISESVFETLNNIPKKFKFNQSLLNSLLSQYTLLQKSLPLNHNSKLPFLDNKVTSQFEQNWGNDVAQTDYECKLPDSIVSELNSYGDNTKTAEGIVYMADGNNLRVVIVRGRPLDIGCVYLSCPAAATAIKRRWSSNSDVFLDPLFRICLASVKNITTSPLYSLWLDNSESHNAIMSTFPSSKNSNLSEMLVKSCYNNFNFDPDYLCNSQSLYADEALVSSMFDKTKFRVDENDISHCNFLPPNKRSGPCKAIARLPLLAALTFDIAVEPFIMKFCFICDKSLKVSEFNTNLETLEPSFRHLVNIDTVTRCYYCDYLAHISCILKFHPDFLKLANNNLKSINIPKNTPIEYIYWSCSDCHALNKNLHLYFKIVFKTNYNDVEISNNIALEESKQCDYNFALEYADKQKKSENDYNDNVEIKIHSISQNEGHLFLSQSCIPFNSYASSPKIKNIEDLLKLLNLSQYLPNFIFEQVSLSDLFILLDSDFEKLIPDMLNRRKFMAYFKYYLPVLSN